MNFEEYILAAGEYSITSTVSLGNSVTYRGKAGEEPAVIRGSDTNEGCFRFQQQGNTVYNIAFHHLVIECSSDTAFVLHPSAPLSVELRDVVIQNSFGGFILNTFRTELSRLDMTNVLVRGTGCGEGLFSEPLHLINVDWTFENVSFIENCVKDNDTTIAVVQDCNVTSSGGTLLFHGNGGDYVLCLQGKVIMTMYGADMLFENNRADTIVSLEDRSSLQTNGLLSFKHNTVHRQLMFLPSGWSARLHSLLPLQLEGNNNKPVLRMEERVDNVFVCITPCEEEHTTCNCNDRPLLSWNIQSTSFQLPFSTDSSLSLPLRLSSPFPDSAVQLHLSLELSAGLVYGQHFTTQPPPSEPNRASLLNVAVDISQNESEAQLNIFRLPATLQEEATITIRVAPDFFSESFFLDMAFFIQVSFQPPLTFQPEQATVLAVFPDPTKPDHTLSLLDPQDGNQTLTNRSVSAQFATLTEVNEDGEVVAIVPLQDTEFEATQFDNATFNLNNALPFLSFAANITSLTTFIGDGEAKETTNLTESVMMKVEFTMFAEEQAISFAGVEQVIAANTLKWSLLLSSWPFQHHSHSLELHLFLSSEDGTIFLRSEEQADETQVWMLQLGTENTEIPVNVLPLALLLNDDDEPLQVRVSARWKGEEQELVIRLPWFEHGSVLLDPDMSLLLEDEEKEEDDDGLWWKVTIPVVLFVIVVAVAVAVVLVQKKRRQVSQRANVNF
ncbi:hypothetical protein QOT17_005829 [Balamuthia mandrillaris]